MPNIFDTGNITPSVQDIKGIGEALKEQAFVLPSFNEFHTLVTGVLVKQKMVILGRMQGLAGKGSGGCNPTPDDNQFTAVEKFLDPQTVSWRSPFQCYKDLEKKFTVWGLKFGINRADLTGTDFADFVTELVKEILFESVLRHAWFGDTEAMKVVDGGVVTNSINLGYLNKIDGLWKQAFEIVGADSSRLTEGLGDKNAELTYADQKFNATDTENLIVSRTLDTMFSDADERLVAKTDNSLLVTKSVFDQYKRELKFSKVNFTTEQLEGGISSLNIDGQLVQSFSFMDRMIKLLFNDGVRTHLPHRAILLSKSNTQIATDSETSFAEVGIVYDNVAKGIYFDTEFTVDAKFGIDYEIQVAY